MKYKIELTTKPSRKYTEEEIKNTYKKALSALVDDLILNGHIKIGN